MNKRSIGNSRHVLSEKFDDISNWMDFSDKLSSMIQEVRTAQLVSEDVYLYISEDGNEVGREIVGFCQGATRDHNKINLVSYCITEDTLYNKEKLFTSISQKHDLAHFQWIKIAHNSDGIRIELEFCA